MKFANELSQLYLEKKRIRETIEHTYRSHIEHIIQSPVYGYIDEERRVLEARGVWPRIGSFIERVFGMSPDLISILNELVTLNAQLKHYIDPEDNESIQDKEGINVSANIEALQDAEILGAYTEMMEHVTREQRLLTMDIKPAIAEIMQRKDWKEWLAHLRRFEPFMEEVGKGLKLFLVLLKKLHEKGHLQIQEADEDVRHRFLVRGIGFNGKLVIGSRADFVLLYIDGEPIEKIAYEPITFALSITIYRPRGKDYVYGIKSKIGVVDAAGRRGPEAAIVKTSSEMNPYEYLLTLSKANVGLVDNKNLKISPPFKIYTIERNDEDRELVSFFRSHPEVHPLILHFEPGSYVYSPQDVRQVVQIETSKNFNVNEIIATLIYGENAYVGPDGMAAISKIKEMLPYIQWMGLNKGLYFNDFFELVRRLSLRGFDPGVFDIGEEFRNRRTHECSEFVRKVVDRFGNTYAKFHILYGTLEDLEMRKHFVQCVLDARFESLDSRYRQGLAWLEAVGIREEIEVARRCIERRVYEKAIAPETPTASPIPKKPSEPPKPAEEKPPAPIPTPPTKPAEPQAAPQVKTSEPARPLATRINFDILNQVIVKCSKRRAIIRDCITREEELAQILFSAIRAERILAILISKTSDRNLDFELRQVNNAKIFVDQYQKNPEDYADNFADRLGYAVQTIIAVLQIYSVNERGEILEQPPALDMLQEIIRRCSARGVTLGNCINIKELMQIGSAASQAEAILTNLISKAPPSKKNILKDRFFPSKKTKLEGMLLHVSKIKVSVNVYKTDYERDIPYFLNDRADRLVQPLQIVVDVIKSHHREA